MNTRHQIRATNRKRPRKVNVGGTPATWAVRLRVCFVIAMTAVPLLPARADQPVPPVWPCIVPGETSLAQRVRRALDQPTRVKFNQQSLSSVVGHLMKLHDIEIELDEASLSEFDISRNAQVTIRTGDVPLRTVLQQMLETIEANLTYTVDGERLVIMASHLLPVQLRIYNIEPLLSAERSAALVAKMLSSRVASTYNDNPLSVFPFRCLLLVPGTEQDHERVAKALVQFRNRFRSIQPGNAEAKPTDSP